VASPRRSVLESGQLTVRLCGARAMSIPIEVKSAVTPLVSTQIFGLFWSIQAKAAL